MAGGKHSLICISGEPVPFVEISWRIIDVGISSSVART